MVIVRLQGGLGNQMFQYAYARALAMRNNCEIKIDISGMTNRCHSFYSLDSFSCSPKIATREEIDNLITPHFALKFRLKKVLKIPFSYSKTHIKEAKFSFDKDTYSIRTPAYCEGFYQTEKYFFDISDTIRQDFQFKDADNFAKSPTYDEVVRSKSVGVHIRRGDYISNPKYKRQLYVCDKNYYIGAMNALREKIDSPHFIIFSDDPEWVSQNFEIGKDTVLASRASCAAEDMFLMSKCDSLIISNSSFSWWAAWLGNGNIIAPDRWFTDRANIDYSDVVPDSWTKFPARANG